MFWIAGSAPYSGSAGGLWRMVWLELQIDAPTIRLHSGRYSRIKMLVGSHLFSKRQVGSFNVISRTCIIGLVMRLRRHPTMRVILWKMELPHLIYERTFRI